MHKLSITITVEVPTSIDPSTVYKALTDYHPEEYRAAIERLASTSGLPRGVIGNPTVDIGFLPNAAGEEEIVRWMKEQVADGSLDADDLCRRALNWGVRSPASVLEEIEERMYGPDDDDQPAALPVATPPIALENRSAAASKTAPKTPNVIDVLDTVEGFIAGFENDPSQEGVPEMLENVRVLWTAYSVSPPVDGRTAFLAAFHGIVGAYPGGDPTVRYRALWPVNGALDRKAFIAARNEAMDAARSLLGGGFCTRMQADEWLTEAGWIVPAATTADA